MTTSTPAPSSQPALPDWAAQSQPVEDVRIDIAFIVEPSFYYGPSSNISAGQWESLREPIYQPAIPGAAQGFVLSVDKPAAASHEEIQRRKHRHGHAADDRQRGLPCGRQFGGEVVRFLIEFTDQHDLAGGIVNQRGVDFDVHRRPLRIIIGMFFPGCGAGYDDFATERLLQF